MENNPVDEVRSLIREHFPLCENVKTTIDFVGFHEDIDSRTVTCTVKAHVIFPVNGYLKFLGAKSAKRKQLFSEMEYVVSDAAKCREGDEYDVQVGKMISRSRVFSKLYAQVSEDMRLVYRDMKRMTDKFMYNFFRYGMLSEIEKNYIDQTIDRHVGIQER